MMTPPLVILLAFAAGWLGMLVRGIHQELVHIRVLLEAAVGDPGAGVRSRGLPSD